MKCKQCLRHIDWDGTGHDPACKPEPRRRATPFRRWSVRFGALVYNDGTPKLVLPELVEVARALNRARVVMPAKVRP